MDIYRSLASPLEKNSLAHYELAYSTRSGLWTVRSPSNFDRLLGQWIVDSGQWTVDSGAKWGTEENKRGRE